MSNYHKRIMPGGRAVSKAQYNFYRKLLDECDPDDHLRRAALTKALQVDYDSLPERAGSLPPPKGTPQPQPNTPPPRVETIKSGSRVACYLVRKPGPMFFIASPKVWEELKAAMPQLKRSQCLTLKEARSFLELEGVKVKSLKEAAGWWSSDCPTEAVPPQPQPQPQTTGWVDDPATYGDGDEGDMFAN